MGHQVSIIENIPHITPVKSRVEAIVKLDPPFLVCVCEFTNWMKTNPLADQKAQTIAMAIYFKICCE